MGELIQISQILYEGAICKKGSASEIQNRTAPEVFCICSKWMKFWTSLALPTSLALWTLLALPQDFVRNHKDPLSANMEAKYERFSVLKSRAFHEVIAPTGFCYAEMVSTFLGNSQILWHTSISNHWSQVIWNFPMTVLQWPVACNMEND